MTVEERWKTLSPRERDAWVDEAAMGRKPAATDAITPDVPCYTTSMGACWKLIDKLTELGWYYSIDGGRIHAEVRFFDGHSERFDALEPKVMDAVCIASLKLCAHYGGCKSPSRLL